MFGEDIDNLISRGNVLNIKGFIKNFVTTKLKIYLNVF